jgi:hypothetical protein
VKQRRHDANQRRLAGAVRAEQGQHRCALDGQSTSASAVVWPKRLTTPSTSIIASAIGACSGH